MSHLVLVVDNDASARQHLSQGLDRARFELVWAADPREARALLDQRTFAAVLLDAGLAASAGAELWAQLQARGAQPVVLLSNEGDASPPALRADGYERVSRPLDVTELTLALERALRQGSQQRELLDLRLKVAELERGLRAAPGRGELLGVSPAMRAVHELLERASTSEANVFISGESGTGKKLLARTIAAASARASGPFLSLHCAALPEGLLESELFGSGGDTSPTRPGLLERASGGTLFLDEVGALSPALQAQLLRVLQDRLLRPPGSAEELPIDVRLICASNQDLETAIEERRFRADLYYRINVIAVSLPPLRARGTDVLLLGNHFLRRASEGAGREVRELSADVERCLMSYTWPGNVLELQTCMDHAAVLARGTRVEKADLPEKVREPRRSEELIEATPELPSLEEIERRYILRVFEAVHGNKSQAALVLGLDRKTLYRRLERYGMLRTDSARSETARINGAPRASSLRPQPLPVKHEALAPGK
ncbi:MAG: hypothetical protein RL033_7757 [Pseudomonadota bacterium]|jgi:two-component system response regulator HydG